LPGAAQHCGPPDRRPSLLLFFASFSAAVGLALHKDVRGRYGVADFPPRPFLMLKSISISALDFFFVVQDRFIDLDLTRAGVHHWHRHHSGHHSWPTPPPFPPRAGWEPPKRTKGGGRWGKEGAIQSQSRSYLGRLFLLRVDARIWGVDEIFCLLSSSTI